MEVEKVGFLRKISMFALGGAGYVGLELLWRGRSHGSMFLAGGTCFLLLGGLAEASGRTPRALQAVAGAGIITTVELAVGMLVNRGYHVWDYRHVPLNFMGQICLPYSLLWSPLSYGAMELYKVMNKRG